MSAALELRDVAAGFEGRAVLHKVDLSLEPGEVLGLVGPNGAGKTTLVRVATRLVRAERGSVLVEGRPLESIPRSELARTIAVVPQETQIPFAFRALEVVLMGRAPHLGLLGFETARDLAIANAALERVGVAHLADRPLPLLSGGERQLVVVARALAQDAPIWLLDEPTAFLDLRHRLEVLELVREVTREGRSALVVSHDLGLASRFCDRLAVLAEGEIIAVGRPSQVLVPPVIRRAFGIDATILEGPDGAPLVVPRLASAAAVGAPPRSAGGGTDPDPGTPA